MRAGMSSVQCGFAGWAVTRSYLMRSDPPSVSPGLAGAPYSDGRRCSDGSDRRRQLLVVGTEPASASSVTRYCFDLSDWDNSGWTSPLGASGHRYPNLAGNWFVVDGARITLGEVVELIDPQQPVGDAL